LVEAVKDDLEVGPAEEEVVKDAFELSMASL
jgi:hypothetical protein